WLRHTCVLLELEAALARAFGDRANASVVEEAVAVEHDLLDAVLDTPLGDQNADLLGGVDRGGLAVLAQRRGECRDGEQGVSLLVGDHLRVDVAAAAEDRQARPRVAAAQAAADTFLAADACDVTAFHQRDAPAAALPALRRMCSPAYRTPLPLYGSVGRSPRMAAATSPSSCRSLPSSVTVTCFSTFAVMPGGSW